MSIWINFSEENVYSSDEEENQKTLPYSSIKTHYQSFSKSILDSVPTKYTFDSKIISSKEQRFPNKNSLPRISLSDSNSMNMSISEVLYRLYTKEDQQKAIKLIIYFAIGEIILSLIAFGKFICLELIYSETSPIIEIVKSCIVVTFFLFEGIVGIIEGKKFLSYTKGENFLPHGELLLLMSAFGLIVMIGLISCCIIKVQIIDNYFEDNAIFEDLEIVMDSILLLFGGLGIYPRYKYFQSSKEFSIGKPNKKSETQMKLLNPK